MRARVRRALVHLTPERLHQKFLAEVRTLPREMARDALLKRLVRVREFGKRVVREEIRERVLAPRAVAELQRRHGGQKRHRVVANGRGGMHETVQRQDDEFRGGTRRSSRERTRRRRRRFEPGPVRRRRRARVQIRERGEVRGGGLFVRGVTPVQGGVREVGVRVEMVPERASRRAAGAPAPSGAIERLSDPRQHATMRFPRVVVKRRTRQKRRHRLVRGVRHRRRVRRIERNPRASTGRDARVVHLRRAVPVVGRRGRET